MTSCWPSRAASSRPAPSSAWPLRVPCCRMSSHDGEHRRPALDRPTSKRGKSSKPRAPTTTLGATAPHAFEPNTGGTSDRRSIAHAADHPRHAGAPSAVAAADVPERRTDGRRPRARPRPVARARCGFEALVLARRRLHAPGTDATRPHRASAAQAAGSAMRGLGGVWSLVALCVSRPPNQISTSPKWDFHGSNMGRPRRSPHVASQAAV